MCGGRKELNVFRFEGRNLSRRINDTSLEYQKLYSRWNSIDFDPLNADGTAVLFEKIQIEYRENADRIERSLAQIFIEAFDECYSTAHCFQVRRNYWNLSFCGKVIVVTFVVSFH